MNHYYAGEAFIPVTSKKLIKLDECDVSTEISLRNAQPQGMEHEFKEHSQNSRITRQTGRNREETGATTWNHSCSQRFTRRFPKFAEDDTGFTKN